MKRMAEVGKDFLQQRFTSAVQRNLHRPALQSYSCDSTPLTTRETYRRAWGDSLRITRKGRMASHFDIQRLWFKSGSESTCMFSEPIRLADGTGWGVFSAYMKLTTTLRQAGHRGLVVSHHCEDRALSSESCVDKLIKDTRRELGVHEVPKQAPFRWTVLGGSWTMVHKKVAYDAYRARAATPQSKRFCSLYGFNTTCRFSLSVYGEKQAAQLADYWVDRLTWFLNLWEAAGSDDSHVFQRVVLDDCPEAVDFATLAASADGQLARRIRELRGLVPSR